QASFLADTLRAGQACPVCGSSEHPNKAHITGDELTREQLNEMRTQTDKAQSIYMQSKSQYNYLIDQSKKMKIALDDYDVTWDTLNETILKINEEGIRLKETVAQLQKEKIQLEKEKENISN